MNTTKTNNLSFYNEQGVLTLNAKQFDTGRRFVFHIMDNDEPFDSSDCTAYLRIAKADGTQFQGQECCKIEGSKITIDPSVGNGNQILTAAGTNVCELHLEDADGISLTTWNFQILVEPRVHDGSHISSVDSYDVLDIAENNEKERERNEENRSDAEKNRQENETQRQENEKTRNEKFEIFESRINEITDEAKSYATQSQSWTVGGTNTRTGEDTDNSKRYYEQIKSIAESFSGTLRPKGTIAFAGLPSLSSAKEGDMYNISDQFTTNTDFKEGSGHIIPAGSNIYKTADGKWDVLAGTPVTGVKGDKENTYRRGNVNITPENIGALSSTGGDIKGNFTVYADGSSPDPDLKVRDGRVDILKTDTSTGVSADSVGIFEKTNTTSRVRISTQEFKVNDELNSQTAFQVKSGTQETDIILGNSYSKTGIKGKNVSIITEKNATIKTSSNNKLSLNLGNSVAEIGSTKLLAMSSQIGDNLGNRAVVIADEDKVHIGTTDPTVHTYNMLMDNADSDAHVSTGMRIEENKSKFTFYQEAEGIQFDLMDLVSNSWFNISNGAYKFVASGDGKFMSNNQGVHSSDAESVWEGIFKQNTDFTLKYKVSSEGSYDQLNVYLDNANIVANASNTSAELTYTTKLKAGKHTLRAVYHKDGSVTSNDDTAYLQFDNAMVSLPEIQIPKYYGTCSTGASTKDKVVSCPGFQLVTGAEITVKFVNGNTASSPTLNVNNTNAKAMYYGDSAIASNQIKTNRIYTFRYDGTYWRIVGELDASNTDLTKDVADKLYAKKDLYDETAVSVGRKAGTTIGERSFAFGHDVTASGADSYATGVETIASGEQSHTEGNGTQATNGLTHAEGFQTIASGGQSHAEGCYSVAGHWQAHAEGHSTTANNYQAHAEGYHTTASGIASHAEGYYTTASNYASHVSGKFNKTMTTGASSGTQVGDAFVIGNGIDSNNYSNALRVTYDGYVYGTHAFKSSGADYAEHIKEWADGNPENEDRVGYMVTIKNGLLHKANEGDYIAGITSGNPSVVGNADEDYYWKYERDEFNRIVMEDVPETIQKTDEKGNLMFDEESHEPIMIETGKIIKNARMKLSENYNPSLQINYIERKDRKEWDYVGMVGIIPVRDDGTCLPDHFCKCGQNGIATLATERGFDTFYVIERISNNVVSVELR